MRTLLGKSNNYKKVRNDCSSAMVLKKPGQMVLFENKVPSLRLRSFYKKFRTKSVSPVKQTTTVSESTF